MNLFRHLFYRFILAFFIIASNQEDFLNAHVEHLIPMITRKIPHDPQAFTQGLAIVNDQLYESTGLYGGSSLRLLNIESGDVLKKHLLPHDIFGEGIAAFPQYIFQLSWKEHRTFIYERHSFNLVKIIPFSGECWGLCRDANSLWMSNGTSELTQRDAKNFALLRNLSVHMNGQPVLLLNDLECDGSDLYANIWQKDIIVRINKITGEVSGLIDASKLLSSAEKARLGSEDVLNGIAYHPKKGTFFLTGKRWPWIFEVQFVTVDLKR